MKNIDKDIAMPPIVYVPDAIDIEVTGRCEYNCSNCWGSKPCDYSRELTPKQWQKVFNNLDNVGQGYTSRVVISGGEPLIRKDLPEIIDNLIDDGDRAISLSTTGLDRNNILKKILGKLSTIGIPIDGTSPEINSIWRKHNNIKDGGLSVSLDTLKLIQENNPDLQTAVRTLIHRDNVNHVSEIPKFLEKSGIDISRLRWILYELNRREKTPGQYDKLVSTGSIASYNLGPEQFQQEIMSAGSKFNEVIIRTIGNIAGRNFIINPSGECRAVISSDAKNEAIEEEFGNLYKNFDETIEFLNYDTETIGQFSQQAADSPEYFYLMQDKGIDLD